MSATLNRGESKAALTSAQRGLRDPNPFDGELPRADCLARVLCFLFVAFVFLTPFACVFVIRKFQ